MKNLYRIKSIKTIFAYLACCILVSGCDFFRSMYIFMPYDEHSSVEIYNNSWSNIYVFTEFEGPFDSLPNIYCNYWFRYLLSVKRNEVRPGESRHFDGNDYKHPYGETDLVDDTKCISIVISEYFDIKPLLDDSFYSEYSQFDYLVPNEFTEERAKTDTVKRWKVRYDIHKGDLEKTGYRLCYPPDSTMSHIHVQWANPQ